MERCSRVGAFGTALALAPLTLAASLCTTAPVHAQQAYPQPAVPATPPPAAVAPAEPPQGMLTPPPPPVAPVPLPQAAPAGAPVATAPAPPDQVVLVDGSIVSGRILKYDSQAYVVVRLEDGRDMIYSATVITRVVPGRAPSAPPVGVLNATAPMGNLPPGHVQVQEQTQLDTAAGTLSHEVRSSGEVERTLLDARAGTARREVIGADGSVTTMEVGAGGASYNSTSDCADPNSPICQQQTGVNLTGGGLTASYNKTSVEAVKEPPNGYQVITLAAGATAIFGDFDAFGATVGGSSRWGFGGKLPGADGGWWNGVGLELGGQLMAITSDFGDSGMFNIGGSVGWAGSKFGRMDTTTLKQSGFGWMLGLRVGVSQVIEDGAEPAVSYGPQITLSLPKYNAGTAKTSDTSLTLFVLPTDGITVVMIQLGFGFGV